MLDATLSPRDYGLDHDTWRPHQAETVDWAVDRHGALIVEAPTGCHAPGQGILMADGSVKNVEDVVAGDRLIGPDSKPRTVLKLYHGIGNMYNVIPVRGDRFTVNEDHVLTLVRTNTDRRNPKKVRSDCIDGEVVDISLRDWMEWSRNRKHLYKLFRVPIDFRNDCDLPVDPYLLGALIGDGTLRNRTPAISNPDPEIIEEVSRTAALMGLHLVEEESGLTYRITNGRNSNPNQLLNAIRRLELNVNSGDKFIPSMYKTTSRLNRLQILAGLLDTDGYLSRESVHDYISKSKRLADDVAFVSRSVGLSVTQSECQKYSQDGAGGTYHRLCISGDMSIIPHRLTRKQGQKRRQKKNPLRTGFSVEYSHRGEYYGFMLDGDGRYLLIDFTVTHNSGKTGCAKAVASTKERTVALTRTKNLQEVNYADSYGFIPLYGRNNYPCAYDSAVTAGECAFPANMQLCPLYGSCEYVEAREAAKAAQYATLNYAYWFAVHMKWPVPNLIVCDEAHQLPDLVLEWAGVTVTAEQRDKYTLPVFPIIRSSGGSKSAFGGTTTTSEDRAVEWLKKSLAIVDKHLQVLAMQAERDPAKKKDAAKAELFCKKLEATYEAMQIAPKDWYIRSGPNFGGNGTPTFIARPLTAKHHFKHLFQKGNDLLIMSATMGDVGTFAAELGLAEYESRLVPSNFTPEQSPVYALDVPRMGQKSKPSDYQKQAEEIAKAIRRCPGDWSGIVHTNSMRQAQDLSARLVKADTSLKNRLWTPTPGTSTNATVSQWHRERSRTVGAIIVTWNLQEGYDGTEEKINICAKAPYPYMGDPYEKERQRFNGKMFLQRTAWGTEQMLGRTRRGRDEDYDTPGEIRGMNCIADGSWRWFQGYFSEHFRRCIQEV